MQLERLVLQSLDTVSPAWEVVRATSEADACLFIGTDGGPPMRDEFEHGGIVIDAYRLSDQPQGYRITCFDTSVELPTIETAATEITQLLVIHTGARAARELTWLASAEVLVRHVSQMLERDRLASELAKALGDLDEANATIEQLQALNSALQHELWRKKGKSRKRVVGALAGVLVTILAGAAGGMTQEATASWLRSDSEKINDAAQEVLQLCQVNITYGGQQAATATPGVDTAQAQAPTSDP
jgi:hypothetical protein